MPDPTETVDLVARIRARPNDAPLPTEFLLAEAADEIERLREALRLADLTISRLNSGAELQALMVQNNALIARMKESGHD